jgi:hypothetical protein
VPPLRFFESSLIDHKNIYVLDCPAFPKGSESGANRLTGFRRVAALAAHKCISIAEDVAEGDASNR